MKIYTSLLLSCAAVVGCASHEKTSAPPQGDPGVLIHAPRPGVDLEPIDAPIDYLGLRRFLGLERTRDDVGYVEKSFETCKVGYGYSTSRNCQRAVFVTIQFQILCRDSEGTVSQAISRSEMRPLSGRTLRWQLKKSRGSMELDGEGFGRLDAIVAASHRLERLKISVDNDFVYVRAGELRRLVTPRNWCN